MRARVTSSARVTSPTSASDDLAGRVHVVVANPPYIPLAAYESVAPEARDFDPPVALWSGDDGLDAIAVVADVAARLLVDGGLLVCEHADVQGESAPAVFAATGLGPGPGQPRPGRPAAVRQRAPGVPGRHGGWHDGPVTDEPRSDDAEPTTTLDDEDPCRRRGRRPDRGRSPRTRSE